MINKLTYIESGQNVPYSNLAIEEYLMHHCGERECILYLWQNQRTVVIGRNQNAWKECRVSALEADGGYLVRRNSGGGAVYHDLGNLNFTFLAQRENYSVEKQLKVIRFALEQLGAETECSGRNDILLQGRKISGSAFYEQGDLCCHHGTLMLDVDVAMLERYLTVSVDKINSKGVDSVRSRVGNLRELLPGLTLEQLKAALRASFDKVYGLKSQLMRVNELDVRDLKERERRFSSWEWNYGRRIEFQRELTHRFLWGELNIQFQVSAGKVAEAAVYSDALLLGLLEGLPHSLKGIRYEKKALYQALKACCAANTEEMQMKADILAWVNGLEL